jgi:hypothetical protein
MNKPDLAKKALETAENLAATPEAADEIEKEIALISKS